MKLGSLFDGSGGFPLAGALCGIEPVWASEIEPYPIRVTTQRFPRMKHLGDITKIDGGKIEPVDVITFGSPCQDLSVAGKRAGIHDGARSSLFFHAVRIMKEMREATNGVYPRIVIWENVPGAFSSNKGQDFRAVLEAFCQVSDPEVSVPEPPKGKWQPAGCIVGDGYSIAWRVYDAQYWGVPQRRKRIYLVADFASERAGEILFERESMRRDSAPSREAWEGTAAEAEGSARGSCYAFHLQQDPIGGRISPCIGGQHQATVGVFLGGQGAKAGGIGYSERISLTLKSVPSGINQVPDVVYPNIARTLTAEHDSSPCVDRGQNVVVHDKIYQNTGVGWWNEATVAETLRTPCGGDSTKANLVIEEKPPRKYIVRRLTPLECCRLQGFPDQWEDGVEGSDSARYKMWGNGIALPCALHVMRGVARVLCE